MIILVAILGIVAGLALGYILALNSSRQREDKTRAELEGKNVEALKEAEARHSEALKEAENRNAEALKEAEVRNQEGRRELQRQFEQTVETLKAQMQAATEEMLRRRQDEFAQSSKEKIDSLLQPLQRSITEMKQTVADNTAKHSELGGRLDANITTLLTHTTAAQASAEKLASALKGSNQVQGQWGETVLRELLESQGLKEGIHFDVQSVLQDSEGKPIENINGNTMRPDVILHLDRNRDVIIDSKVSLSAYLEYINSQDEAARAAALDKHIRSIENHVSELIKKDYAAYKAEGKTSLGYVIMFVPNTTALLLATSNKPDLWRKAMERKVYIADEQTLYAALKIINLTWQQIAQASNHEKVYELAQEMLDRVGKFMESYVDIGSKLELVRKSYDAGMGKLKDGGQSIPGTCQKLKKLGATASKTPRGVPPELLGE